MVVAREQMNGTQMVAIRNGRMIGLRGQVRWLARFAYQHVRRGRAGTRIRPLPLDKLHLSIETEELSAGDPMKLLDLLFWLWARINKLVVDYPIEWKAF